MSEAQQFYRAQISVTPQERHRACSRYPEPMPAEAAALSDTVKLFQKIVRGVTGLAQNCFMDQTTNDTAEPPAAEAQNSESTPRAISEFVAQNDFPECTRGKLVNIGGYTGVVVDIVGNSLKVKSPEETTKSFNFHTLRKLYAPREEIKPMPAQSYPEPSIYRPKAVAKVEAEPEPEPPRNVIENPDFTKAVRPIQEFTGRVDYPKCTFGEYVDVGGYKGVVVEIVKGSLKVRSPEEIIRSYNSEALRKLYPAPRQI
jgi:hypothetical protein